MTKKKPECALIIRLTHQEKRALKQAADRAGDTMNSVIRMLVRKYVLDL